MHDFSLAPPVDIGVYEGPLLKGQPLHPGTCEDGVYGCRRCGDAISLLSSEELKEIGVEDQFHCDWCKNQFPLKEKRGIRPWDEPSCYYEICGACDRKHHRSLMREAESDRQVELLKRRYPNSWWRHLDDDEGRN